MKKRAIIIGLGLLSILWISGVSCAARAPAGWSRCPWNCPVAGQGKMLRWGHGYGRFSGGVGPGWVGRQGKPVTVKETREVVETRSYR